MRLEIDLDMPADEVAARVAARLADRIASQATSPWMAMDEAIAYTRIPAGTFRKLVAADLRVDQCLDHVVELGIGHAAQVGELGVA